jgi:WD40 repeat protein
VKIWDKNTGGLMRTFTGYGNQVVPVAFDSTYFLASGSYDMTIKIWNKHTGDLLKSLIGHR